MRVRLSIFAAVLRRQLLSALTLRQFSSRFLRLHGSPSSFQKLPIGNPGSRRHAPTLGSSAHFLLGFLRKLPTKHRFPDLFNNIRIPHRLVIAAQRYIHQGATVLSSANFADQKDLQLLCILLGHAILNYLNIRKPVLSDKFFPVRVPVTEGVWTFCAGANPYIENLAVNLSPVQVNAPRFRVQNEQPPLQVN